MDAEGVSGFFSDPGIWLILGFLVLMYLMIIAPQNRRAKEHKAMLSALNVGDEVIAAGGLVGIIRELSEQYVLLETGKNIQLRIQRTSISHQLPRGTITSN